MSSLAGETFYLGTYTSAGKSRGIYRYELDGETGAVTAQGLAAETESPSFLALHPNGKFLYAANEVSVGAVSAFAIQPDGSLRQLNQQSAKGGGTTFISLDHAGRNALVANYNSGSVAVLPIHEDGALGEVTGFYQAKGTGPDPKRQQGPHAHSVYVAADDRHVFSCDLGLDRIFRFDLEPATGLLTPTPPIITGPGSGPRHLALGPGDKYLYLAEEMGNALVVFERMADDSYKEVQRLSLLPDGYRDECSAAEVMLHPNGRFIYCTLRGADLLAAFSLNPADGRITLLSRTPTGGKGPRFFTIDPSGRWLLAANQTTGDVVVFALDPKTGALKPSGQSFHQDQPVCMVFTGKP